MKTKVVISFFLCLFFISLTSAVSAEKKYIYNESFEETLGGKRPVLGRDPDGIKYWMRWTDKNNEQSAQNARTGKYSFKVIGAGGIYQDFAGGLIDSNETYQINAYAYIPQGQVLASGSYAIVKLEWLNSGKRLLSKKSIESRRVDDTTQKGQWVLVEIKAKPPADARFGRVTIEYRSQGKNAGTIYWDDFNVRALSNFNVTNPNGKTAESKREDTSVGAGEEIDWQW